MNLSTSGKPREEETPARGLEGLKRGAGRWDLTSLYGLLVVLALAVIQLLFSLNDGGYYVPQWYPGAVAVSVMIVVATLVPGYFSLGRKQWAVVGALVALTAVVGLSILWSISRELSFYEASRTAMYAGVFTLALPVAARWGWLVVDTVILVAFLPPALYGLLQKIFPTVMEYTGFGTLETDPRASSTVGYHPTFGLMCAMGALLVAARVSSLRSIPLRVLYSAVGFLFLVALYFSFSRGAVIALAGGVVVLLILSRRRFETLGNLAVFALPALWTISRARDLPGIVARPMSLEQMALDGWALTGLLLEGVVAALVLQLVFSLLVRGMERFVPGRVRKGLGIAGAIAAVGVIVVGLAWGWATFQNAGGFDNLRERVMAETAASDFGEGARDKTQRYASLHAGDRILLWQIAWENWQRHPLTGTGGDTYRFVYEQERPEDSQDVLHPHSMWMSLLSDTGIFAFLAFAAFCVGSLALAAYNAFYKRRSSRSRALIAGSAAAMTAYLISSSVDWNWYIPASTIPFFALAAVATGMTRRNHKEHPVTEP